MVLDIKLLIGSQFLSFKELFYIHLVLKLQWKTINYILTCHPQDCGPARYLQWKQSLFLNPNRNSGDDLTYYKSVLKEFVLSSTAPHSEVVLSGSIPGEILRDVVRTYQASSFFKEGGYGRNMLQNVLCALVKSRPDVGYCQGMNFVVGAIIIGRLPPSVTHMALAPGSGARCDAINAVDKVEIELEGDEYLATRVNMTEEEQTQVESDVFHLMLELFDKHGKLAMNGLWADRVPKLKLRVYQLDRLLKWNYPRLHDHFDALKLSPEVLTAQWFVTLFAYNLPLHTTLHLWDYLFETGWEGIFKVAISLLGAMESQFMALEDLEGFAMLMREWKKLGHLNINMTVSELLNRAHKLVINSEVLTRLQECFGTEILSLAVYCQKEEREVQARLDKESVKTGGNGSNSNSSGSSGSFSSGGSSSSHGGAAQGSSMHSGTTIYNSNLTNGNHHTGHNNTRNYNGSNSNNHNTNTNSHNNTNRGTSGNSSNVNITINTSTTDSNNAFSRTNSNTSTGSNGNSNHSPSAGQKKELAIGHGKYLNLALKTAFSLYNGTQNGTKDNAINNSSNSSNGRDSNNNLNSSVHSQSSTTSSNNSFQASSSPTFYNNANQSANLSNNSSAPTTPVQHAVAAAELEEQQGRGSVIEDEVEDNKIKLGEELPTYWLLRYGNKLSLHEIEELCNYRVEIRKLDRLVDVDKAKLHVKIIKACEFHRATQEELEAATEENLHYTHLVDTLTASFQHSLVHAQDLAEAVARLMDVYHIKQDVSAQDSFSGKEMSGYGGVNNMIGSPQPGTGSRKMRSNSVAAGSAGGSSGNSNSNSNSSSNSNSNSNSSNNTANISIGKRHSLNSFMRENGHFNTTNNSGVSTNNNGANVSIGNAPKRYSLRTALYNTVTGTNDDITTSSSSNSSSNSNVGDGVAVSGSSGGNIDNDVNSLQNNNSSVMFPRMRNALRLSAPSTTTTTPQTTHSAASVSNHFPTLFTTPTKQQPTSNTNSPKVKRKQKDIKDHDISELLGVIITSRTSLSKTDRTSTSSGNTTTNRTSGASRTSTSTTVTSGGGAQQQMRQNSQDTNGSDTSDDDVDDGTDTTSRRRLYGISGVTPTMSAKDTNETSGSGNGVAKRQSWRDSIRSTLQSAVSGTAGASGSAGTTPTNAASSAQIAGGSNGLRSSSSSLTTSDSTTPDTPAQHSSNSNNNNNADVSVSAAITQENLHRIGDSDVITTELNPVAADSLSTGDRIRAGDGVAGSGGIARQLRHLEKQSQHSQQKIIEIHRSLEEAKKVLAASKKRLQIAVVNDDEAMVWKKSLCDQLQLLVEDSNRGRSQKLIFISENYLL